MAVHSNKVVPEIHPHSLGGWEPRKEGGDRIPRSSQGVSLLPDRPKDDGGRTSNRKKVVNNVGTVRTRERAVCSAAGVVEGDKEVLLPGGYPSQMWQETSKIRYSPSLSLLEAAETVAV